MRELEVGRYPVRWRQRASRREGVFAGLEFDAPCSRAQLWQQTTDYADFQEKVPGVSRVTVREESPVRRTIDIEMRVLWRTFRLAFEVEEARAADHDEIRFRLAHEVIGEYRGVCWLRDPPAAPGAQPDRAHTTVGLATWLKPARPVPMGLILLTERMAFLHGVQNFLESLDRTCYTNAS